jgi:hypothetical protein
LIILIHVIKDVMVQQYGIKNFTANHCVCAPTEEAWTAAPPSPAKMKNYITYFGWEKGDYILCGSRLATFRWDWDAGVWRNEQLIIPPMERRFTAPAIAPHARVTKKAMNTSIDALAETFRPDAFFH